LVNRNAKLQKTKPPPEQRGFFVIYGGTQSLLDPLPHRNKQGVFAFLTLLSGQGSRCFHAPPYKVFETFNTALAWLDTRTTQNSLTITRLGPMPYTISAISAFPLIHNRIINRSKNH